MAFYVVTMASYVDPASGPKGTSFLCHIEGLSSEAGCQLTVQLYRAGSGYRLDNSGPVVIPSSGVVELRPRIPYGGVFVPGVYDVGAPIWYSYPDKLRRIHKFATFTITPAQLPGSIRGTVVDAETDAPIMPWVNVNIIRDGKIIESVMTDMYGKYSLTIAVGDYEVEASHVDYRSQIKQVMVESGKASTVDFALVKKTSIPPVVDILSGVAAFIPLMVVGGVMAVGELGRS